MTGEVSYQRVEKVYAGIKNGGGVDFITGTFDRFMPGNEAAQAGYAGIELLGFDFGPIHQTVIKLTNFEVTVGNTTGVSFGSKKVFDFPEGRILMLGATAKLGIDVSAAPTITQTGSGDWSVGSAATADGTLSGTEVDLVPSVAMVDPFVSGIGASTGGALAASAQFDGTSTAKDAYLNVLIDSGDIGAGGSGIVKVSGNIVLTWIDLGDY